MWYFAIGPLFKDTSCTFESSHLIIVLEHNFVVLGSKRVCWLCSGEMTTWGSKTKSIRSLSFPAWASRPSVSMGIKVRLRSQDLMHYLWQLWTENERPDSL